MNNLHRRKFLTLMGGAVGAALVPAVALPAAPVKPPTDILTRIAGLARCLDAQNVPLAGRWLYIGADLRDELTRALEPRLRFPLPPGPYTEWHGEIGSVYGLRVFCEPSVPPGVMYASHIGNLWLYP